MYDLKIDWKTKSFKSLWVQEIHGA